MNGLDNNASCQLLQLEAAAGAWELKSGQSIRKTIKHRIRPRSKPRQNSHTVVYSDYGIHSQQLQLVLIVQDMLKYLCIRPFPSIRPFLRSLPCNPNNNAARVNLKLQSSTTPAQARALVGTGRQGTNMAGTADEVRT